MFRNGRREVHYASATGHFLFPERRRLLNDYNSTRGHDIRRCVTDDEYERRPGSFFGRGIVIVGSHATLLEQKLAQCPWLREIARRAKGGTSVRRASGSSERTILLCACPRLRNSSDQPNKDSDENLFLNESPCMWYVSRNGKHRGCFNGARFSK